MQYSAWAFGPADVVDVPMEAARVVKAVTVERFVSERFVPDRIVRRKPATRSFYTTVLRTLCDGAPPAPLRKLKQHSPVGPVPTMRTHGIGALALSEVRFEHVQDLVNVLLDRGYSVVMARKVQSAAHLVFGYAQRLRLYGFTNPAEGCTFPEPAPVRERHALTLQQLRTLLAELQEPYRTMVLTAALTGLNVAELAGLRWGRINLTDAAQQLGDVTLPARSLWVCEQYSCHGYGTVKTKGRKRAVPLATAIVTALGALPQGTADAPVFTYANGRPINAKSALTSVLKPAGRACAMPWLCWHDLRRTFATLTDAVLTPSQRQALLGHASASMTAHYTLAEPEAARAALDALGASL